MILGIWMGEPGGRVMLKAFGLQIDLLLGLRHLAGNFGQKPLNARSVGLQLRGSTVGW